MLGEEVLGISAPHSLPVSGMVSTSGQSPRRFAKGNPTTGGAASSGLL